MSSFLKRFKVRNQENVEGKAQDEKKKDEGVQNIQAADSTSSSCDEGLSLFSGMTFSSDTSPPLKDGKDQQYDRHSKPASKELEESGLDLSFKQQPLKQQTTQLNCLPVKDTKKKGEQDESSEQSSSVLQSKKKKRSQAKRPGYARDCKTTSSHQQGTVKSTVPGQKQSHLNETKETPHSLDAAALVVQEKRDNSIEDKSGSKEEEIEDEHHQDELFLNRNENNIQEEENSRKDSHQVLYSIGTPSSSEENLTEVLEKQKEDNDQQKMKNDEADIENVDNLAEIHKPQADNKSDDEKLVDSEESTTEDLESNALQEDTILQETKYNEHIKDNETAINENSLEPECCVIDKSDSSEIKVANCYELKVDAEEKHILVELDMQFQISSLSEDEEVLSELKKYLILNYSNLQRTYLEKQKELDNLTQEESNALAKDNYDLAEELSVKIELVKDDLENTKYQFPGEDKKVQEAVKLASDLAFRTLSIHREAQNSLEELKEKQVAALDTYNEAFNSRISKEKQQLTSEKQRIDRAYAHLQLDIEHLEKEESLLEDEISGRTEQFDFRKKELTKEQEKIREEIAELEERLLQLRLKESQYSEEIKTEQLKIDEVLDEFLPQREPLTDQKTDLENQQILLDTQQEALTAAQEEFNKSMEEWDKRKTRFSDFLESLQSSINRNNASISLLEKKRGELEEFQCLKHLASSTDAALDKLKSSAKISNQQIKNLKSKLNLSNRNIALLRKRLTEIEAQISDINEAKDIAKKERNFKEAKRLKEESEELNSEGVESQKKLENIIEELNNDTCLLKNAEKDFEKITHELQGKEYETDLKLVKSAAQVAKDLETQLQRYKDNEMLHTLLNSEISTCQNLIKELCAKHDIPKPDPEEKESDEQDSSKENIQVSDFDESKTESQNIKDDSEDIEVLLEELEVKLEVVVEIEDFDEAQRIQQQIDELKSRLE